MNNNFFKKIIFTIITFLVIIFIGNVLAKEYFFDLNFSEEEAERKRDLDELKDKKLVAFTFDDGPSGKKTEKLLNGLKERNAKVTFFLIGNKIEGQEDLVRRIYNEGHTIGSHTYSHKNLFSLKDDEILEEILEGNKVIEEIINEDVRFLRPPYGNYNHKILDEIEMSFMLWNIDTNDWKVKSTKKIRDYIVENVSHGDIVLLHDLYNSSIEGVLEAIDILEKEGFAFVSIEEMEELTGEVLLNHNAYYKIKK